MKSGSQRIPRPPRRMTRGSVLIESAFGLIILTIFTFGIVEVGWYYRDAQTLNTMARDCARDISQGMTTTQATTEIQNGNNVTATSTMLQNGLTSSSFTALYSTDNGVTFPSTQVVGNDASGGKNNVPMGAMVMVTITYQHSRITGLFGKGTVPIQVSSIMVRQ